MGAPKGHPQWGGRKKGTPNKSTSYLQERCEALGVDPFEILIRFAAGDWKGLGYESSERCAGVSKDGQPWYEDTISPEVRQKAAKEACEYLYPKRKAMELSADGETGFKIVIEDYSANKKP